MENENASLLRSAVSIALLACAILVVSVSATAGGTTEVARMPEHPAADVMGYVLETAGGSAMMPLSAPATFDSPYPYQSGWPLNISAEAPSEGPVLVDADSDPQLEILFAADLTVHLLDHSGSYLPGWPVTVTSGNSFSGQAAFGDLDGDGSGEVVVTSHNWPNGSTGWTFAYHADGSLVEGFPFITGGDHTKSPTVADLDGDGSCEIIVGERDYPIGRVYVCDGAGQLLEGWPQEMNHVPAASAGAADIDGDDSLEIVFESYNSIYAYEMDGSSLAGFPYTPSTGDVFSYSAPVFADVDGDDFLEIAVGGHSQSGSSHMFLLNHDGTDVEGWPTATNYWIYAPGTFVDLDGDEDLELLVGDQVMSGTPVDHMYAWHHDGSDVSGWPVGPIDAINAQVAAADFDGDGDQELAWDTNITPGKLMGYHHTGDPITGWPITTEGTTFFNTVALGDVDLDEDLELLVLTQQSAPVCTAHLWDMPDTVDTDDLRMPMFQYGPGRDGGLYSPPAQGVESGQPATGATGILAAYPNPFSGSVSLNLQTGAAVDAEMEIFDLTGRMVASTQPEQTGTGAVYQWNGRSSSGSDLPSGVYVARVRLEAETAEALLLKLR